MWNELVTSALIGTERRAFTLDNLPEALRELAAQIEGQDAEHTLLRLAGAMALYRRAGQSPQIDPSPLPEPSKPDTLPLCSPRSGLTLQQILALSQHKQHLPEWIAAAYNAHRRVPPEYLPRFLIAFEKNSRLPDHFYDVLGERGRWLAKQNPAWAYAVVPQTDAEWELADINARLHYLRQLRASDPAHARALVESIWSSEKADTRMEFLRACEIGLSLDDEPFLEAALDDRSINVRAVAVDLLPTLNGSAYQERMIARVQPLIQIERKRKGLTIAVNLPESCDASMQRDGIPAEPPKKSNLPDNSSWLTNIANRLPSSYWLSGDWSARELVETVSANHNWRGIFLGCLAQIAEREHQHNLADALLEVEIEGEEVISALRAATPAAREAYILRSLEHHSPNADKETIKRLNALRTIGHHWSEMLTRTFLSTIRQRIEGDTGATLSYASYLQIYATDMAPACAGELHIPEKGEGKTNYVWNNAVKQAAATLEFRQKMLKEFSR